MWYNVHIDPIMSNLLPEDFSCTDSGAKGAVCHYLYSSGLRFSWVNQTVPFAYD
jgi:hypothetical protein